VTDLAMPDGSGRDVAAAVKAEAPATLVVMLTGQAGRMRAEGAPPPDVDVLMAKPARLAELRSILELARRRTEERPAG
jgi:DNA-binding NarL/FixJ family response regulator